MMHYLLPASIEKVFHVNVSVVDLLFETQTCSFSHSGNKFLRSKLICYLCMSNEISTPVKISPCVFNTQTRIAACFNAQLVLKVVCKESDLKVFVLGEPN